MSLVALLQKQKTSVSLCNIKYYINFFLLTTGFYIYRSSRIYSVFLKRKFNGNILLHSENKKSCISVKKIQKYLDFPLKRKFIRIVFTSRQHLQLVLYELNFIPLNRLVRCSEKFVRRTYTDIKMEIQPSYSL